MSNSIEWYVGLTVITKEPIPSDRRGLSIPAGTPLIVSKAVGAKHCDLEFGDGKIAASQVPISKLKTG